MWMQDGHMENRYISINTWQTVGYFYIHNRLHVTASQTQVGIQAMSLGDRFLLSRKDGTGRGAWVHMNRTAMSGLSFRKALVGTGWAI